MTISIDTNVIVALWWNVDPLNHAAVHLLTTLRANAVRSLSLRRSFAELLGDPKRSEADLDLFLEETGIAVEWPFEESLWRQAGLAYQALCAPPPYRIRHVSTTHPGRLSHWRTRPVARLHTAHARQAALLRRFP